MKFIVLFVRVPEDIWERKKIFEHQSCLPMYALSMVRCYLTFLFKYLYIKGPLSICTKRF